MSMEAIHTMSNTPIFGSTPSFVSLSLSDRIHKRHWASSFKPTLSIIVTLKGYV
jgi:hypothetical protein